MNKLNIKYGSAVPFSNVVNVVVLAAGVEETATVPTNAKYVNFVYTGNVWVRNNGTAAVPTVDVTDGSGSVLNPDLRIVEAGDVLHFIAEAACNVQLCYYGE